MSSPADSCSRSTCIRAYVLGEMLPHLMAGDEAEAGRIVTQRLRRFARSQAEAEARIQVDREHETAGEDMPAWRDTRRD